MDYSQDKENVGDGVRRSQRIANRKLQASTSTECSNLKTKPLSGNKNKCKVNNISTDVRSTRNRNKVDQKTNSHETHKKQGNLCEEQRASVGDSSNENNSRDVSNKLDGDVANSLKSLSIVDDKNQTDTKDEHTISSSPARTTGDNMCKAADQICNRVNMDTSIRTTPITLFKAKQYRRTSRSPNPQNFLCKADDPVVQRIESPKPATPVLRQQEAPKSAMYFHQLVEKEEFKFRSSCEKWNKILDEGGVPEECHGNILAAIGQALLFQNKRFKQFKELIELHKDKSAEKTAYVSDLHGFWEMIYYQVEDVHKRFAELEILQSNNWEVKKVEPVSKPKPVQVKKVVNTKAEHKGHRPKVSSKFKLFRQQMMAKKQAELQNTDVICST